MEVFSNYLIQYGSHKEPVAAEHLKLKDFELAASFFYFITFSCKFSHGVESDFCIAQCSLGSMCVANGNMPTERKKLMIW